MQCNAALHPIVFSGGIVFDLRPYFVVACGAALGGVLRYAVSSAVILRFGTLSAPLATLIINVSGSFFIGVVLETARVRTHLIPLWRPFLATGILGGYTTFSTFSFEALMLYDQGQTLTATAYIVASIVLGLIGVYAGVGLARVVHT